MSDGSDMAEHGDFSIIDSDDELLASVPMMVDSGAASTTLNQKLHKKFANLTEANVNELDESVKVKSTQKQTKWSVTMFKRWLKYRGHSDVFEDLSPQNLEPLLRQFYAEVRNEEGESYSKSTFVGIRAGINRHLRNPPHNRRYNILVDPEFQAANNTFKSVLRKLKQDGLDLAQHHAPICTNDLAKLRTSDTLNPNQPLSLLRKVWFDLTLSFLRRGNENQSRLTPSSFHLKTDANNKRYLEMAFNEATKNHPGDVNTLQTKPRMYETGTPLCPVASFLKYTSLRCSKIDALYQMPKKGVQPEDTTWYTARPLGHNKLDSMMKTLSVEAGLSRIYTNHCVRATGITLLSHANVESREIMRMSGHRCESSIKSYNSDSSEEQKRQYSSILNSGIGHDIERASAPHPVPLPAPAVQAVMTPVMPSCSSFSHSFHGSHSQFKIDNSTVNVYNYTIHQ